MELVVAAETETGQLASDGPEPLTESPTTEGMAKTGLREPPAVFATVTSQDETPSRCSLADASADKPNPETIRRVHLQIEIVGLERVIEELQTLAQPTCERERYDGSGLGKVRGSSAAGKQPS